MTGCDWTPYAGRARLRRAVTFLRGNRVRARSQNRDGRHITLCPGLAQPGDERPQNGLIGFDWVRLSAPAGLTLNGYTTPAAVRRNSCFFELGGSAGMKASPFHRKTMRNYPKLSWKSTTCDAWPALPIDLNTNAGGIATAPFSADLIAQISMNKPHNALT